MKALKSAELGAIEKLRVEIENRDRAAKELESRRLDEIEKERKIREGEFDDFV